MQFAGGHGKGLTRFRKNSILGENDQEGPSLAEQVAEKRTICAERPENHTSGAEDHIDLIGFMPGINPRPTARRGFSSG
jgi:hypothetical protein